MIFWDSSALASLFVEEADSPAREAQLLADPDVAVWYGTHVEVESALCRGLREGALSDAEAEVARARMAILARTWIEVDPTPRVRDRALRLVRVHPLRAADAFQLAAALALCGERTRGQTFLTGDQRLREAACKEGFLT